MGKLDERVALTLSSEVLVQLRVRAKATGRTLLGEIRYLIQRGMEADGEHGMESRLRAIEEEISAMKYSSLGKMGKIPSRHGIALVDDHVMVPKLDVRLAAGAGGSGTERVERSYAFDRSWIKGVLKANPIELRLVDVTGQSMEPTYWKGDLVLVDLSRRKLQHEHIYALRAADGPLIKRLCRDGKGWHLHSDNPDKKKYPDQPVQIEELEVVGEVLWLAGRRM